MKKNVKNYIKSILNPIFILDNKGTVVKFATVLFLERLVIGMFRFVFSC